MREAGRGTRLHEQRLELGSWTWASRAPHPLLRPLLARDYVGFSQESAQFKQWLEPPPPAVTLIVDLEGRLRGNGADLPRAWIGGLGQTPSLVEHGGRYAAIDIKLTPLGAYRLLGFPLTELADRIVGLEDLFGRAALCLEDRLLGARDWDARFDLLDAFLIQHTSESPGRTQAMPSPGVAWAWSELLATGGQARTGALAESLGWSRRRLASEFRRQLGLPPKTVARLIRFAELRRRLDAEPVRWADIAYECGYCDQSHLIRDFRQLAGTTPTDFLARRLAGGGVIGDGITFVQDTEREPV